MQAGAKASVSYRFSPQVREKFQPLTRNISHENKGIFHFFTYYLGWLNWPASSQISETEDERGIPTIAPLIALAADAVLDLSVESSCPAQLGPLFRDFFNAPEELPQQSEQQVCVGSGVIVDADAGYVLTNHHVITDSDQDHWAECLARRAPHLRTSCGIHIL